MLIVETKDNNYTTSIDGITLHSKYSPAREADKFIKSKIKSDGTVIIIGAGLGYLYTAIEILYPNITVIGIPLDKELGDLSKKLNNSKREQWDYTINLSSFLKSVINTNNIKGLQVLEWEPTSKVYKEMALEINKTLVMAIRRVNGNLLTTARFGQLWIKNSIKNYLTTERYISQFNINKPIIIVASGSSLNKNFTLLKEVRDKIVLIALSSANMALKENNITADLIFSTDPGYYSKLHLNITNNIIAMPLTNSTTSHNSVLLLNQGNPFEKDIIKLGNLPHIKISENGTVAGTALEFALSQSKSEVFLLGQDLESADLISHVTPYAFDNLLKLQGKKDNPHYSIMYKRWVNQGVSFKTYRDWFSDISLKNPNRIFRINNNSLGINGITDIDCATFKSKLPSVNKSVGLEYKILEMKNESIRVKNIENLLNEWLISLNEQEIIENPLFYLISTSKYTDINNKALSEDLINIKIQECREESILFIKRLLSLYGRKLL